MHETLIRHPRSGELYAVAIDGNGEIVECAGPLVRDDAVDDAGIGRYLRSFDAAERVADARWLTQELTRYAFAPAGE